MNAVITLEETSDGTLAQVKIFYSRMLVVVHGLGLAITLLLAIGFLLVWTLQLLAYGWHGITSGAWTALLFGVPVTLVITVGVLSTIVPIEIETYVDRLETILTKGRDSATPEPVSV